MTAASVRIERLDLKVGDRDLVHRFRNDLEDALRTASLARLPTGARLSIRRLRLGRVGAGSGRQALARHLEARLAAFDYAIALPGAEVPRDADAVLVPDLVAGAAIGLDALHAGRPLPWYVAAMFPPIGGASADQAAARIAQHLVTLAGVQAPGRLADHPGGVRRLIRLVRTLPDPDVRAHLEALAPTPAATRNRHAASPAGMVASRITVARETSPLPHRIAAGVVLHHVPPLARRKITAAASALPPDPARLELLVAWLAASQAGPQAAHLKVTRFRNAVADACRRTAAALPSQAAPASVTAAPALPRTAAPPDPAAPHQDADDLAADPSPRPMTASTPVWPPLFGLEGALSDHAGLWLLVAVLRLVGLDAAETATGLPLGPAVLSAFADRLRLSAADPARACLATDLDMRGGWQPDPWLPRSDILRLLAGRRGLWLARRAPGRAGVALRDGQGMVALVASAEIRRLRAEGVPLRVALRDRAELAPSLVRGLMLATQRLVRLTTGSGWQRLAARRGRVVATATHLDIEFDGRDVDPAVRMAGLDIDPGWVPWLGRVVSFHYDYSRVRNFPSAGRPS